MGIVKLILQIYIYVILVRIILTWIPLSVDSPFRPVVHGLEIVTDPVLVPVRKILPPLTVGGMGIDLSPIVVLVILEVIVRLL